MAKSIKKIEEGQIAMENCKVPMGSGKPCGKVMKYRSAVDGHWYLCCERHGYVSKTEHIVIPKIEYA